MNETGVALVSIGSAAFLNPALLKDACAALPGKIFGSIDARDGKLAIKGWVETSALTIADAARRFREAGVAAAIVTDISRDGTEAGINVDVIRATARSIGLPMIALLLLSILATCLQAGRARGIDVTMDRLATAFTMVLAMFIFIGITVHFWNYMWIFLGLCIGVRASLREWLIQSAAQQRRALSLARAASVG